jgi:hypothetical protein
MYGHTTTDIDQLIYSKNMMSAASKEALFSFVSKLSQDPDKIFVVMFPYSKEHGNCFLWVSNGKPCLLLSFDVIDQQAIQYLNFSFENHILVGCKDDVALLKEVTKDQVQTRIIKDGWLDVNYLFKGQDEQLSLS